MEDQLITKTNNEQEDEVSVRTKSNLQYNNTSNEVYFDDVDSSCSTPFVSAPTSPDRAESVNFGGGGFFYSAPASPMHFVLCSVSPKRSTPPLSEPSLSFDFGFSARHGTTVDSASGGSMSSADELFFNGQIRPMKLSNHHKTLAPLPDLDESEEHGTDHTDDGSVGRGRDLKCNDRSLRRRARSTSPLRKSSFQWLDVEEEDAEKTEITETIEDKNNESSPSALGETETETTPSMSTSSSRSSSTNRNSKKWLFLKDLLHRSKSEGSSTSSNNGQRFWSSISFSPVKDRKASTPSPSLPPAAESGGEKKKSTKKVVMNGVAGKSRSRGVPMSAHELHYKASRAQTEEMRKKTFLPYKQGVLGCLGFSSKSYGAMNGFARALNPVSSR
ncbi:uncharacterized protein LOC124935889 [Impatiens glandulifera]|uniref:uncharacterized protein LOC124935889 n=1 Tax=Impatiens glandulifera TaxID=253017 RepID=UPI001FB090E6|nr:uncharacterized protein LOC124935889 [Impatiens glandulifera]